MSRTTHTHPRAISSASFLKNCAGGIVAAVGSAILGGCAAHGHNERPANPRPAPRVVGILLVEPAAAHIAKSDNEKTLKMMGGLASVVGGALAGNNMYRASASTSGGVSITYTENGRTFISTQLGRLCEYTQGDAIVISASSAAIRIQPNAACPTLAAK